jgi:hypothetical protein
MPTKGVLLFELCSGHFSMRLLLCIHIGQRWTPGTCLESIISSIALQRSGVAQHAFWQLVSVTWLFS